MDAASALLVLVAAGVNFGWQPAENAADGYDYIVQVEPELLDTLRRGESVPIESNVPPEVGPIRKVSIVVGRGDLPRDTLSAVQRTAYFAGQGTWTPDRNTAPPASAPATTSTYDRYGQLPATSPTGVSPPPSVIDRAQAAATETGTALRDGVEAGFEAANQQFSRASDQVIDATRNAGQEFGQQLQGFANDPVGQMQSTTNSIRVATEQTLGTARNQSPQVANPFAASSSQPATTGARTQGTVAPPPWPQTGTQNAAPVANASNRDQTAARGMTPIQTQTGWTSIGSNVAAPPLIIPQPTVDNHGCRAIAHGQRRPQFSGVKLGHQCRHNPSDNRPRGKSACCAKHRTRPCAGAAAARPECAAHAAGGEHLGRSVGERSLGPGAATGNDGPIAARCT